MEYIIDLENITTREGFHEAVKKNLPVPEFYGRNLDALFDFITEKKDELFIRIINCRAFRESNREYFNLIETVLKDSKVRYDIDIQEDK